MDKDLQDYYENRFTMMTTKGWQDLVEDVQELKNSLDGVLNVKDEKDLYIKKGQLDILEWILNLKKISEQTFEELENEKVI